MSSADEATLGRALQQCADEPIHQPGAIQPHGALLVLSPDAGRVLQASANVADVTGTPLAAGAVLAEAWPALAGVLQGLLQPAAAEGAGGRAVAVDGRALQLSAHAGEQGWLVELEPASAAEQHALEALHPRVQRFMHGVEGEADITAVCAEAAREMRALTGFDRVLVYRFDDDWHGTVLAESRNDVLPALLDLRFPASDIPAQARALYLRNRVRIIPDAGYVPVPVLPAASPLDGRALDLSSVSVRSVSPVHLEYMRNMGTAASMSVSIVIDGRLWGLVACHNQAPRRLGSALLSAGDFLGQMLALLVGARERGDDSVRRLRAKDIEVELLARMSRAGTLQAGLSQNPEAWLGLLQADGAAVLLDDAVLTTGRTPEATQIQALVDWIRARPAAPGADEADPVFATHALPALYPPASAFADTGCGVVAVQISALHAHYVLWFRPEVVRTVRWGGVPRKLADEDGRLHPRRSFEQWSELLRGQSARWTRRDLDAAASLRNSIINFVLRRAEERAALTSQLQASNRELETFSYSVSHDLRAPFRHIVGFAQLLREEQGTAFDGVAGHYVDSIIDAALSAGRLVDDLLSFSQLGRASIDVHAVDMNKLAAEVRRSVEPDERGRSVQWQVGALPPATGDAALLRQALANLVDNALKYTRNREVAEITLEGEERGHETVYSVRDNGVGFDMTYADKLFGVFQRLHRIEEFEGSGIGLALARRIIDRHGGWIAAEGRVGQGATFRFGLPRRASHNPPALP